MQICALPCFARPAGIERIRRLIPTASEVDLIALTAEFPIGSGAKLYQVLYPAPGEPLAHARVFAAPFSASAAPRFTIIMGLTGNISMSNHRRGAARAIMLDPVDR